MVILVVLVTTGNYLYWRILLMKHKTKITLTKTSYILYDHITSTYTHWEKLPGAYIERPLTMMEAQELINSKLKERSIS